jgi:hypothetical protein
MGLSFFSVLKKEEGKDKDIDHCFMPIGINLKNKIIVSVSNNVKLSVP